MSRFSNLEFDGENQRQGETAEVFKDESYYVAEARKSFAEGDFESALRWFSKTLEYNPDNAEAWAGQARMLIELGSFNEAKVWADKALERLPSCSELLAAKAVALARLGDVKGAMAFSDASMEGDCDAPYLWLARADVMLARKDVIADYCMDKMWLLAKGEWLYAWLAGRVYAYYEKFALALKFAQHAIAGGAQQCMAWLLAGQCQAALGLAGPAKQSFSQALDLNPRCTPAQRGLAGLDEPEGGALQRWWRSIFPT